MTTKLFGVSSKVEYLPNSNLVGPFYSVERRELVLGLLELSTRKEFMSGLQILTDRLVGILGIRTNNRSSHVHCWLLSTDLCLWIIVSIECIYFSGLK